MAIIHDLHQIIPMGWFEWFQSPVINDDHLDLGQLPELFVISAVSLCLGQFQQQNQVVAFEILISLLSFLVLKQHE